MADITSRYATAHVTGQLGRYKILDKIPEKIFRRVLTALVALLGLRLIIIELI